MESKADQRGQDTAIHGYASSAPDMTDQGSTQDSGIDKSIIVAKKTYTSIKRKFSQNASTISNSADAAFVGWLKNKQERGNSKENPNMSFLRSLLPVMMKMTDKQNRRFHQKVIGLMDVILEDADIRVCHSSTSNTDECFSKKIILNMESGSWRNPDSRNRSARSRTDTNRGRSKSQRSNSRSYYQQNEDTGSGTDANRDRSKTHRTKSQSRPNHQKNVNSGNRNNPNMNSLSAISQIFDDKSNASGVFPPIRAHYKGFGRSCSENSHNEHNENRPAKYKIGFKKLEEFLKEEPDQLIMKLLSASAGFTELILSSKLSPDFIVLIMKVLSRMNEFLTQLTHFIIELPIQSSDEQRRAKYFWSDPDGFFESFNNYCDMILTLSPTTALEVLKKLLKAALITIPRLTMLSSNTRDMMEKIQEKLIIFEEEFMSRYKKKNITIDEGESEPPDDFRSISLYPLPIEITNRAKAFVRKNIIEGSYKNVDHYLDIQFRLLREDFVKPLREGICDYKEDKKKVQNIKFYHNVTFISPYMVNSVCGVLIQLHIKDNAAFKKKIENSRRFMFGSLMCFTSNNFRSVIFGKIVDPKYLMIESSVYFEPYYHVLKALQQLCEENFPMRKYIIEVRNEREPPRYLPSASPSSSDYDSDNVDLIQKPRAMHAKQNLTKLNQAQYKAYHSAMNESFSIIQGPPGTEGLLSATTEIVRIGGQSKNKNLEVYNIRNLRKTTTKRLTRAFYEAREDVQNAHNELKRLHEVLDISNNFCGIVNILTTVRSLPEILGSWFEIITPKEFQDWLFGGDVHNQTKPSTWKENTGNIEEADFDGEFISESFDDPNEANYFNVDDMFDTSLLSFGNQYIVAIVDIKDKLRLLREKRKKMGVVNDHNHVDIIKIDNEIQLSTNLLNYLQIRMTQGKQVKEYQIGHILSFDEPHNIHPDDRWALYFYWLEVHRAHTQEKINERRERYQALYEAYEELREIEDIQIMRHKLVVGMTTTGAARLRGSLRALKSPIVIVEEAAEIMESHVITSLTEHCTHLILIGDHQQLRPSTADYTMEKQYYLGISLFERMVRNNINCNVLSVQHRMRPEIAKLIAPNIYPHLQNHESVNRFPPVRGIDRPLYFITHKYPEEESADQSKSNIHEVKFLLRLAKYLLLNGYEPEDITIIAAYSGQMFLMFKERRKFEILKDVRITVLDNYQGEESKIILLSLVRNNENGKIGFLSLENRVCVALSRAREGLYIMGNMDLLCANSNVWQRIRNVLEEQDSLGTSLALRCQIHHDKITAVANETDFQKVSEGGCDLICGQSLPCGHQCKSFCHILNRDHNEYQCKENCIKVLCDAAHVCPKPCYKECGKCQVPMLRQLECGHESEFPCYQTEFYCNYPVSVELPCNHRVDNKPCHIDIEKFRCQYPCEIRIDACGHSCAKRCHIYDDPDHLEYKCFKPCARFRKNCSMEHKCSNYCCDDCPDCDIVIKKQRSCTHFYDVRCSVDVETLRCKKPCKKKLSCGHPCKLTCEETCGNCKVKIEKTIPDCGHKVKIECSKVPTTKDCKQNCVLELPCGHKCKNKCKEPCTTKCEELVDSVISLGCGHSSRIPCFMNTVEYINQHAEEAVMKCKELCSANLECGHGCSGSCGECFQGRIHKICFEHCGIDLVCGHKCTVPCRQICPPCFQICIYKCSHNRCGKRCGDICTPCKEFCPRRCSHISCEAWCSSKCTVDPCEEPCSEHLPCGHQCIGFCGEPCPPLCKICNRDELLEFYLGFEEEEDARFVVLQECGHVIESRGMQMWLESSENEITVKRCPRCRTPLTITRRYYNYIRDSMEQVQKVKLKFFGNPNENKKHQMELKLQLEKINDTSRILSMSSTAYSAVYKKLWEKVQFNFKGKRQTLSKILAQILMSKIQIFEQICRLYQQSSRPKTNKIIAYIDFLLRRLILVEDRMSSQEVSDYTLELQRLRRILQLGDIEAKYPTAKHKELYTNLESQLFSFRKYDVNDDYKIKQTLETLSKEMGGALIVTDDEMRQIVKAIGVKQGAWYQCPNGHPYSIGDCGGANQISKCADCGAQIGGTGHRLLTDNRHFPVDGSRFAAWSEQANMQNYQL
ncbi:hypothetical protein Trydic_g16335 [Trypoxylus dichotomus]